LKFILKLLLFHSLVLDIDGDDVLLGVEAPEWMEIDEIEASLWEDEVEEFSPMQAR
jgi:sRNA-binding carbon storage regulator CsrA